MSYEVFLPQVTQGMTEGTILKWLKREGDKVESGEPLYEMMTDKAATEVECPSDGVLGKILIAEGDVPIGTTIAIILKPGESLPAVAPTAAAPQAATVAQATAPSPAAPVSEARPAGARVRVSPLAKRLAVERNVDLSLVTATGPGGLITEADVKRFLESPPVAAPAAAPLIDMGRRPEAPPAPAPVVPGPAEGDEVIPLQGVRKIIAERMSLSRRTAADVTTVAEVDMSEVSALREHVDITYTAFVARAVAVALQEYPILNSRLAGDKIIVSKKIHLGVAVAIDEGLKVPVLREANTKSLRQIGEDLADLAKRGAEGKLKPEELTGSTFTVTNSGVFGSLFFTPIINPPEVGIIGVGKIVKTPVVRDDQIVIRKMMYVALSYDHRVVDGAPAVKFLQRVKGLLEKPAQLI